MKSELRNTENQDVLYMYGRQHSIFDTVYYWFWVFCQFMSNIKPFLSYCIAINFSLFFLTAVSIREIEFLSFVLESAKTFTWTEMLRRMKQKNTL